MTVYDFFDFLDQKYDFSSGMDFDNVGLLVGDGRERVTGVLVCLDCTDEAINEAVQCGANLIITHHPVIFEPLKSVTEESLVYRLIRNGISVISAHTNLDSADGGVNDTLAEILGLINIEKIADNENFFYRIGELDEALDTELFAKMVSEKISAPVRFVGRNSFIKRVAVCSGSGGSLLGNVVGEGVDAFVTADIKHNVFLDADQLGITLIDAGHFNTEDIIVEPLCKILREEFPNIKITAFHFSPIKHI